MPTISASLLRSFAADLLRAGGFAQPQARQMAELLVWANLRGVDSHGVLRIPRYLEMLDLGMVRADYEIVEVRRNGAVCVLDAGSAPGAVAMNRATVEAAGLARTFGVGWCGVRRTSHAGAVGFFAQRLTEEGLVGIVMTASKPLMSYHGAVGEAVSTNPLAIGVPQGDGRAPLLLDMSTAAVALGKIMAAKDAGRDIPLGWATDAEGAGTTDPTRVAAVLPMAGPKGSGLSLMIEVLCSLLTDSANIAPALTGGEPGDFNGLVLAVDPAAFGDAAHFLSLVRGLAGAIGGLRPAAGFDRVLLPGERGHETAQAREAAGIPVAQGTVTRLVKAARALGVAMPEPFA